MNKNLRLLFVVSLLCSIVSALKPDDKLRRVSEKSLVNTVVDKFLKKAIRNLDDMVEAGRYEYSSSDTNIEVQFEPQILSSLLLSSLPGNYDWEFLVLHLDNLLTKRERELLRDGIEELIFMTSGQVLNQNTIQFHSRYQYLLIALDSLVNSASNSNYEYYNVANRIHHIVKVFKSKTNMNPAASNLIHICFEGLKIILRSLEKYQ